jgi:hypothetical protein
MSERSNSKVTDPPVSSRGGGLDSLARRLRSLQECDVAVLEAIQIGGEAIPTLRALLFERDCAGVFQPRTRAVQALSALHAYDVLKGFLSEWKPPCDPIERLGDEAVVAMAANALASIRDEESFAILYAAARAHPVPGIIEALGAYARSAAIPLLIEALLDDCAAAPAKRSLRALGQQAVPALTNAALQPIAGASGRETPSSIRRRRHALSLLIELGVGQPDEIAIRSLIHDPDDEIAALACRIGFTSCDRAWSHDCASRMLQLLRRATWPLRGEIEDCLISNAAVARSPVENVLRLADISAPSDLQTMRFVRSLHRILMAAAIANGNES